jgi:hypothetical protein
MTSDLLKVDRLKDDLLKAYRAASQFDTSKPSDATMDAILSYADRAAKAANIDTAAAAQNDHSWRITGTRALGGLFLVGVVGMLAVRMFPDLQKHEQIEAPLAVSRDSVAAATPAAAPAAAAAPIAAPTTKPAAAPMRAKKTEQWDQANELSTKDSSAAKVQAVGNAKNENPNLGGVVTGTTDAIAETPRALPAPAPIAKMATQEFKSARAAPASAAPPMTAPAAPAAPALSGVAFPANTSAASSITAPTASEQLLALINDERGACKPAPSLAAVRRLLAQGANPSFDKFPFGDHGTITRRAQLCGFEEVAKVLAEHTSRESTK